MKENHITHVAGHLVEFMTFTDDSVIEVAALVIGQAARNHVWGDTFRMIVLFAKSG